MKVYLFCKKSSRDSTRQKLQRNLLRALSHLEHGQVYKIQVSGVSLKISKYFKKNPCNS